MKIALLRFLAVHWPKLAVPALCGLALIGAYYAGVRLERQQHEVAAAQARAEIAEAHERAALAEALAANVAADAERRARDTRAVLVTATAARETVQARITRRTATRSSGGVAPSDAERSAELQIRERDAGLRP